MKKIIFRGLMVVIVLSIGGKILMDKREKDNEELRTIQTDLANYLYNHYEIYTKNKEKIAEADKKYNGGNGTITDDEYLESLKNARQYFNIEKIEFTGFSVGPMKGLVVGFIINDVYPDETTLDTRSAETNKWLYSFNTGNTRNSYVLTKKTSSTDEKMPEENIIYYDKGVK
ncbi:MULTISPECIES: hypothetical protein [unclassified Enterococcus]|uniref:hypothetical protein n=1 Tax=unclassified Enterococcus TaxID=2608891 RepID=UPI0013EC0CB5|nr:MULTISPECIES: hypothetical protein [unclassified Enterococcus]